MNVGRSSTRQRPTFRLAGSYAPSSLSCPGGEHARAQGATFKKVSSLAPTNELGGPVRDAAYRADVVFRRWDVRLADFRVDGRLLDVEPLF
jgi:hypothetical protein